MLMLEHKKPAARGRSALNPHGARDRLSQGGSLVVRRTPSCPCGGSCPRCQTGFAHAAEAADAEYEREAVAVAHEATGVVAAMKRRSAVPALQRTATDEAASRLLASDGVHVSQPGDRHEEEAERTAVRIMQMAWVDRRDEVVSDGEQAYRQRPCAGCEGEIQRQVAEEEEELSVEAVELPDHADDAEREIERATRNDRPQGEEDPDLRVDREPFTGRSLTRPRPNVGSGIRRLNGGGSPLPASERSFFEPRFGADFGTVRIHTGSEADRLARAVDARAFVVENHVVFRAGEFQPGTIAGRRLLAHELTHTIQQGAAPPVERGPGRGSGTPPTIRNISAGSPASGVSLQRAVTSLVVAGAAAEAGHADHFVSPRGAGALVATATVSDPALNVAWTGGSPQPGDPLSRRISTALPRTVSVTADTPADPGSQSVTVHVVNGRPAAADTPADLRFSRQPGNPPGLAPFGLTDVRTNDPVPRIRAFVAGNQWQFRVERIRHRFLMGVMSGGQTTINTPANATNANHCQVIADLMPPPPGAAAGPPRANFWSRRITIAHENAHVARFYSPPFWEAFMRIAEGNIEGPASNVNVDHTGGATLSEAGVVAANAAAHQAIVDTEHANADAAEIVGAEVFAHGQSNPMYTTLIGQIGARFRPLRPTALVAAATGPTSVQLNWTHNACNETEYRVHRRRGRGGFAQIATLPAGSVAFLDTLAGLTPDTDFSYVVMAAGVAGESARSNVVAVRTPP